MNTPTVRQLIDWIIENRRKTAFKDWPYNGIGQAVLKAIDERTLFYVLNLDGQIQGVALGHIDHDNKVFHCENCLTNQKGAMRALVHLFNSLYPTYTISATRHLWRKQIYMNTNKLERML